MPGLLCRTGGFPVRKQCSFNVERESAGATPMLVLCTILFGLFFHKKTFFAGEVRWLGKKKDRIWRSLWF